VFIVLTPKSKKMKYVGLPFKQIWGLFDVNITKNKKADIRYFNNPSFLIVNFFVAEAF
tara:strand:+ start:381 stop:554 length:174 start_codon:yes stop_codon:yes gene_type:complete